MRVVLAGRPANCLRCCCRLGLASSESFRLLSAEPHLHPQLALNICHGPLTTLLGWRVHRGLIPVRAIDLLRGPRRVACMLPSPNWTLHLWRHVLHAGFQGLLPAHAVLLETVGDGQRYGKADLARTTSLHYITSLYQTHDKNSLLPAGRGATCKKLQRAISTKH